MADAVSADSGTALRIHTREELGVDPAELPSPFLAGAASLLAFSLGAFAPLLPFLVGLPHLAAALVLTSMVLLLGGLAVAVTFGAGHLIGSHSAQARPAIALTRLKIPRPVSATTPTRRTQSIGTRCSNLAPPNTANADTDHSAAREAMPMIRGAL